MTKNIFDELLNLGNSIILPVINKDVRISPYFVGKILSIHNGKEIVQIPVLKEMVNHKVGEFITTRSTHNNKKTKKKKKKKK
jgi:ribosomal protein S19